MPKTARADVTEEKDKLAQMAGYSDFNAMSDALASGTTLNASNFGATTVSFGGMTWFPVLATGSNSVVILTLYLEDAIEPAGWADGTCSISKVPSPASNDYTYSWIRSALNMGQTSDNGVYYGMWQNDIQPTRYENYEASDSSYVVPPTEFTTFSAFVGNQYVISGPTDDFVWLPSLDEINLNGSWGLTSIHFGTHAVCESYGGVWTRSPHPSYPDSVYALSDTLKVMYPSTNNFLPIRPAINVNLTKIDNSVDFFVDPDPSKPTADTTVFTYSGLPQTYLPNNFDESTMTIAGNKQTNVGEYSVIVHSRSGVWSDITFKFIINKAKPKVDVSEPTDSFDISSGLPDIEDLFVSAVNPENEELSVAGTITWNDGQTPTAGTNSYTWIFTPTDTDNYETVTGSTPVTFNEPDDDNQGGGSGSGSTDDNTGDTDPNNPDSSGSGSGGTGTGSGSGDGSGDGSGTGDGSGSGTGSGSTGGGSGSGDGTGTDDGNGSGSGSGDGSGSGSGSGTGSDDGSGSGSTDSDNNSDNNSDDKNSNGSGSFSSKILNFLKKSWWWLLIALAALTLLIIIIVVASRRKKNDDEKKAKKEEKAKREEEQIRAIEQQAPVAAASMAMAQPVVQPVVQPIVQPVQQPVQPVVVQQPNIDLSILAEMRADIAEIKAKQSMPQVNYIPAPQAYAPAPAPATAPAPQSTAAPAYAFAPAMDNGTLARLEAQMNAMQAEQRARYEAEQHAQMAALKARYEAEDHAEVAALRAEQRVDRESRQSAELAAMREQLNGKSAAGSPAVTAPSSNGSSIPAEVVVALLQAVNKGGAPVILNAAPAPVQAKPAVPPDAVVTTTTTVDRSKNSPANFDVDGFYEDYK